MINRRLDDPLKKLENELLIFSNYFHPEPIGSAPPITDLAAWAGELGLRPNVMTARPSYPHAEVYPGYEMGQKDREVFRGAEVQRVPSFIPRSRGLLGRLAGELSFAVSAVFRRKRRFAGVVCVCPSIFVVAVAPMFRRRGGRVVAIVHDIQSGLAQSLNFGGSGVILKVLQGLERWSLNRCDHIVALTEGMAGELRAMGVTRPIEIIPPQVDVREITPRPESMEGPPVLLYSGNLGRKQGLDQVLALAAELQRRGNPARLLIRGEGSERTALEFQARADGLDNLAFADLAPRAAISQALGEATLHLVPQSPGGANFALPSKIFSIMSARRAYVATAEFGTPLEVATRASGGGVCVSPGDVAAFADAVEALLADGPRRGNLGMAGRDYVETVADRQVVCRDLCLLAVGQKNQTGMLPTVTKSVQDLPEII